MSIVWERRAGDTLYQVRRAGHSIRLYTNGVFHSQYNPNRPVTGSVWDLLWLPAFFYKPGELKRILVLGVGGGAAIQHLRTFIRPEQIVGVECSKTHIMIARRFFNLKGKDINLHQADAIDWVKNYQGPPFDMIIDDLFIDNDGEPQRAVAAGGEWAQSLVRMLTKNGLIVSNFATRLELETSAYRRSKTLVKGFEGSFQLSTAQNYNAVGVFLKKTVTTKQLRNTLKKIPALDPRKARGIYYCIETLSLT